MASSALTLDGAGAANGTTAALQITSGELQLLVSIPTTNTLTASTNNESYGTTVTFTSTVTAPSGAPSGTVTFLDGTNIVATPSLINGVATYTTNTLAAGTHLFTGSMRPTATIWAAVPAYCPRQ